MLQISVVIPTYYRVKDLNKCLKSIVIQTILPKEIVIVDDSEDDEIKDLIILKKKEFQTKRILLKYIKNKKEKSLTIARNIGVNAASGDIILFLDSDVILDKNYIKEISKVYEDKPDALGVQGLITNAEKTGFSNKLMRLYNRLFLIRTYTKNKFTLLPSMGVSIPSSINKVINCEWLSGANQSYKKDILKEFKFDENLKKYSWGEDMDMSYQIFKTYPKSLFMTPSAKLIHNSSQEGRHVKKELIYIAEVYSLYLFYKNIDQNFKNKFMYAWSRFGKLIFKYLYFIGKPSKAKLMEAIYATEAIIYCISHLKDIKERHLNFFNKELK